MREANSLLSSDSELLKNRNYMMSPMKVGTKADGFERKGQAWFVATELQSDLVVEVGDISFHLHKFPLLSRSGRLNRLVFESRDTQKDHIKLLEMPGGPESFELAAKFCYGVAVDLTASNIAALRCAAEYLEMTEDLEDGNLISKTEAFLSFVVLASWKDSITVLQGCETLSPWADNLQIVRRCSESIAWKACTDPRGISWSFTGRGEADKTEDSPLWNGLKNDMRRVPHDWWFEDVSSLCVEYFVKVITAIRAKGMRPDLIGAAVVQYALKWLPGLDREQGIGSQDSSNQENAVIESRQTRIGGGMDDFTTLQTKSRVMLESIVSVLPPQKDSASCSFLLRLLRMANMLNANAMCRKDLERRVGLQLDQASLTDLLIPSFNHTNETLFDVDLVQRIVESFLLQEQTVPASPAALMMAERGGYESLSRAHSTSQNAKMKVAKLIDSYLAEVARDANLSLAKFQALAEELPEYARACDDGLYRAIDTYLKAHPGTTELERKRLCRIMDCQKLSLDACMHAAQNERLPLRIVVQVLFCEQVKLRNAITGSALTRDQQAGEALLYYSSNNNNNNNNSYSSPGGGGAGVRLSLSENGGPQSLQEGWSTARRDIKAIKLDVETIKTKCLELQSDYASLQQQLEKISKSTNNNHSSSNKSSFPWTSGWKKLTQSKIKAPQIFGQQTRLSIDESGIRPPNSSNGHATPSVAEMFKPRRWRNSIDETGIRPPSTNGHATPSVAEMFRPRRWRNSIS